MPRRSAADTEASRLRILSCASRLMRTHGFDGVGIDAIVSEAGLTPGAFYTHFESKAALFAAVVNEALSQAEEALPPLKTTQDLQHFANFYLSNSAVRELGVGCVVASMSADLQRHDGSVRQAAAAYIELVHRRIVGSLTSDQMTLEQKTDWAWRVVAQLIGGLSAARILAKAPREQLLKAVRDVSIMRTGA
jgi:TetR/AcrR family transcriptional regulator, transcriptional repressor for nem operon